MKALKVLLKTIKYLLISVLLVVFAANFYVMMMSMANPGTHPDVFGYSAAVVISGSMQPEISVDDVVIIKEKESYVKGDIIAFRDGKSFVTHRIQEVTQDGFVTKGDANNVEDRALVQMKNISGKVVYVIPKVGGVIYFLRSPLGMMLIILFAFGAMLIPDKKENSDNQKTDEQ